MNWCLGVVLLFTRVTSLAKQDAIGQQGSSKIYVQDLQMDEKTLNVKEGDIVKVIAPSCRTSNMHLPLVNAYIESIGLVADVSANIYSQEEPIYANTDEFRAEDLISALLDDNVKIIWCIRGGTGFDRGSIRLIPYLEAKLPATLDHKIFVGYDDITILHLYLQHKYGWQTIHGLTVDDIADGLYDPLSESVTKLVDLIFERRKRICFPAKKLNGINVTRIESQVVGGQSAAIESSVKTLWEVNTTGRILFLEDLQENGDHIEIRLDYLKQTRIFDDVVAVIFGNFDEASHEWLVDLVLNRFAASVSFPVFRVHGIGHGEVNLPVPLLTNCDISIVDDGETFEFCVGNIRNTNNGNGVHLTSKFNYLTTIVIGLICLAI